MDKKNNSDMCVASVYNVIFINEVSLDKTLDMIDDIADSKYYRHEIKHLCNLIERYRKAYKYMLSERIGDNISNEFCDNSGCVIINGINNELNDLRDTIKDRLKGNTDNVDILSSIWLSKFLINTSVKIVDSWIEYFNNGDGSKKVDNSLFDIDATFKPLRLSNIDSVIDNICEKFNSTVDGVVDLSNDDECLIGAKNIIDKLCNDKFIGEMTKKASSITKKR